MSLKNSELRYGTVAMSLHWLIALLVVVNIALGFTFNEVLDHHDPLRATLTFFHKPIGLTVLVLSVARLVWRLVNPIPPLPADLPAWMKVAARGSHYLLYLFIIGVPLLGWAMVSASKNGKPTSFFGLFDWPNIGVIAAMPDKDSLHHSLEATHIDLAYLALALALVHIGAALYHYFVRKDTVLLRMLPGSEIPQPPA